MIKLATKNDYLENVNPELKQLVDNYKSKTNSTGAEEIDYANLYLNIRTNKYKEIFEAGTGVTTLVIAYALYKNYREDGIKGRVTSMEEIYSYHKQAVELLPEYLKDFVDYRLSEVVVDYYSIYRGFRYSSTPIRKYDFCWIDGPACDVPKSKGKLAFDIDLIHILNMTDKISGFIDCRYSTSYVFQQLFGEKIRFVGIEGAGVGVIDNVCKSDLDIAFKNQFEFYLHKLGVG